MFAKLLKHECRAIFKYWWIAAVSSVLFAMLAGFCSQITDVFYTTHYEIQAIAGILSFFSRVALFAFPVLAALLVFIRFRKHLFSDEGYLTFTLPVSKGALLGSKLVTAMIFAAASVILLEIDFIIASICYGEPLVAIYNDIIGLMKVIYSPYDLEAVIFGILLNIILIAFIALLVAFFFLCITFANVLVKKRRVLTGIGIFYGVQIAITLFFRIMGSSGAIDLMRFRTSLQYIMGEVLILVAIVIVGTGFYLWTLYLLDKKLNLE